MKAEEIAMLVQRVTKVGERSAAVLFVEVTHEGTIEVFASGASMAQVYGAQILQAHLMSAATKGMKEEKHLTAVTPIGGK